MGSDTKLKPHELTCLLGEAEWVKVKGEGDRLWRLKLVDGSYLTVLDRGTGFTDGYGNFTRDTETGYRDPQGKFWLASGMVDVRELNGSLTLEEVIAYVKREANTCKGD